MPRVDLTIVGRRLSHERLAPYQRCAGGDLQAALRLYEWNTRMAGAFWITLGTWRSWSETPSMSSSQSGQVGTLVNLTGTWRPTGS
jgi:hypothetical protein